MAPHSSALAWEIPWTEEPGKLQSMGSRRVRHDWATSLSLFTFLHWRRKWQPTPVFLPGESQGQEPGGLPSVGSHRVGHDWCDFGGGGETCTESKRGRGSPPALFWAQVKWEVGLVTWIEATYQSSAVRSETWPTWAKVMSYPHTCHRRCELDWNQSREGCGTSEPSEGIFRMLLTWKRESATFLETRSCKWLVVKPG